MPKTKKPKKTVDPPQPHIGAVGHSTLEQRMFMISWLKEDVKHLGYITGKASKTVAHGQGVSKIKACEMMAEYIYQSGLEHLATEAGKQLAPLQLKKYHAKWRATEVQT